MALQTQITENELRDVFADTLDKGASRSAILVSYRKGDQVRTEVGVPYSLTREALEIGPYFKDIVTSPPSDYHDRKRQIPISDIVGYKRIELSDIL